MNQFDEDETHIGHILPAMLVGICLELELSSLHLTT